MEGCDSNPDGSPSELVHRRYNRLSAGAAGLIWYEACAVVNEGRANPLQMYLTRENIGGFEKLLKRQKSLQQIPVEALIFLLAILQLTHSGRYSRPVAAAAPIVPQHDAFLTQEWAWLRMHLLYLMHIWMI